MEYFCIHRSSEWWSTTAPAGLLLRGERAALRYSKPDGTKGQQEWGVCEMGIPPIFSRVYVNVGKWNLLVLANALGCVHQTWDARHLVFGGSPTCYYRACMKSSSDFCSLGWGHNKDEGGPQPSTLYMENPWFTLENHLQIMLVGGFKPSEKYESQLGWWHSQFKWENKSHVPVTTNQ